MTKPKPTETKPPEATQVTRDVANHALALLAEKRRSQDVSGAYKVEGNTLLPGGDA
ncbi:hypothetical protein L3V43_04995 [Pseudoalteromonas sp. L23]|uniref:hypothetical protein n=1 Tax=unclassified Pseudoalteromonas TaxID=194690 RepID=UPI001EF0C61F|nr:MULTISPECIES: hypothetical protein [unclassified Pseudoalteromonas]MCF7512960.1 hypothetical protein [Pseudoalteromonas sp. L7]MCF7525000.1 hypothetical protein [Pseudoalteromonas sp. L23]